MSRLSPRTAWLRILRNVRCSGSARVNALNQLRPPAGLELLRKLLADPNLPPKLRVRATEMYAERIEARSKKKPTLEMSKLLG